MPQISTKPVLQKLGLKPTHRAAVLRAPKGAAEALGKPPKGFAFAAKLGKGMDFVVSFYESEKQLVTDLPKLKRAIAPLGMAWVCWRKGNVTDLGRDSIAALGEDAGLEGVSSVSVSADWSALKLMHPKSKRLAPKKAR